MLISQNLLELQSIRAGNDSSVGETWLYAAMTQISACIQFTYLFYSFLFSCSCPKINSVKEKQSLICLFNIDSNAIKKTTVTVWESERRKSMSLISSISFISAGGWGRLRPQRVGWWCDLAGLSVISGMAILAPLVGLGYNLMWCPGPRELHCSCYQPVWLKSALTSQTQPGRPHAPVSFPSSFHYPSHTTKGAMEFTRLIRATNITRQCSGNQNCEAACWQKHEHNYPLCERKNSVYRLCIFTVC